MNYIIKDDTLKNIADAIRNKTKTTDTMTPVEMPDKISAITNGGGTTEQVKEKAFNFYDFDGTLLHSYTKEELNALTALPDAPDHTGDEIPLTFDRWNWTIDDLKTENEMNVGANYHTTDGYTHFIINVPEHDLKDYGIPYKLDLTNYLSGEIDWGDGTTTTDETVHEYAKAGNYHVIAKGTVKSYKITVMTRCSLPSSVTSIGSSALSSCYSLQSITIPAGVTSIGSSALSSCYSLQSITIPASVTSIGSSALSSCYSLQSITIPASVTSIGSSAFSSCSSLQNITIPAGVTSIGRQTFQSCRSLQSITFPSGLTSIGGAAFSCCYSLQNITLPSGLTSIADQSFASCDSLQNITLPSSVTSIGSSAFSGCYSLQNITLPSGLTSIGGSAFSSCSSLQNITLPSGLTSIGSSALSSCYSLQSITIPAGVTNIGDYVFQYCLSLKSTTLLPNNPPKLGTTALIVSATQPLYVPYNKYKTATNWSQYADYMIVYKHLDLSELVIDGADSFNVYKPNQTATLTVYYNADDSAYDNQKGVTWSVSGPAALSDTTGDAVTVTASSDAKAGDTITVTATSTYNNSITATHTINCIYTEQGTTIDLNNGQWVDTGSQVDGHTLYKSDAGSYHTANGKSTCTITFKGYSESDPLKLYLRSYGESGYDYVEVGPIDGTVSRDGSSNLLILKNKDSASTYTLLEVKPADTNEHTIQILYSKDSGGDRADDRGYFYIAN